MSDISNIELDYILGTPERAAQAILAAIDGRASKRAIKKLIVHAENLGVDVGQAVNTELQRRDDFYNAFRSKTALCVSGKPYRIPFYRPAVSA